MLHNGSCRSLLSRCTYEDNNEVRKRKIGMKKQRRQNEDKEIRKRSKKSRNVGMKIMNMKSMAEKKLKRIRTGWQSGEKTRIYEVVIKVKKE